MASKQSRKELKKALIEAFYADKDFSETEREIMASFGFEHDGTDEYNPYNFTDTADKQ